MNRRLEALMDVALMLGIGALLVSPLLVILTLEI